MAQVTKNAFKGYSFQEYVYLLFACLMDMNKGIININAEIDKLSTEANHNFDDIKIVTQTEKLFVQVKNYKDLLFSDIKINVDDIILGNNKSVLKSGYKNIVILNDCDIEPNSELFGFKAFKVREVYVISLSVDYVSNFIDELFNDDRRVKDICNFVRKRIFDGEFFIRSSELPLHKVFSQKLKADTVYLRNIFFQNEAKIIFVVGKPGVGKSHFVNEFCKEIDKKLIYRFWIYSQDSELQARLQYSNFLKDLSYRVFKKSGTHTEDQIIDKIRELKLTLIIDGLDHVENYNHREVKKYFDFLNMLKEIKVIVLTRPLKHKIEYEIFNLGNWDYNQTKKYLELCYGIHDKELYQEIFKITDGYPIITYYVANHYLIYDELVTTDKIEEVNDYYNLLISDANILSAITIFLVCNSFLSKSEIVYLSYIPVLARTTFEFIESYPYLFEVSLDRYSLIHDSLYRYLLLNASVNKEDIKCFTDKLMNSFRNRELRFLNRLNSLYISDEDKVFILKKYSDFNAFNDLLLNNWDIEAIKEFYNQLDYFVKSHETVLDHYQYYSLVLIQECCSRIDLSLNLELLYQQVEYLIKYNQNNISNIYSNGVAFRLIKDLMVVDSEGNFLRKENGDYYSDSNDVKKYLEIHKEECKLLSLLSDVKLDYKTYFYDVLNSNYLDINEGNEVVAFIIAYLYIHDEEYLGMKKLIFLFLSGEILRAQIQVVNKQIHDLGISYQVDENLLHRVRYLLYEIGYFEEENPYLNICFDYDCFDKEDIELYDSATMVANAIRLTMLNDKKIEICTANRCYISMAYEKDNSFVMLPEALNVFEKYNVLEEDRSIDILSNLVDMTSGLYFLLSSYVNLKSILDIERLLDKRNVNGKFDFNILDLVPEILEVIPFSKIRAEVYQLMNGHVYGKIIEERDVYNILQTAYADDVLKLLSENGFRVMDISTHVNTIHRKPEEKGYIELNDLEYIKSTKMDYLTIARYPDGLYECFSNLELYKHFDNKDLQKDYVKIINESMKCEGVISGKKLSYNMYLGNIPCFIDMLDIPCEWEKMYSILMEFLRLSFYYKN